MRLRNIAAAAAAGAVLVSAMAPAAMAADPADVTVTGGDLAITAVTVANFDAVTLDGQATTTNATMDAFSVTDARGTGAGWKVTGQATRLTEWDGSAYGTRQLDASSLVMPAPTVAANGTTSPDPTIPAASFTLDGAGAVDIAVASADQGMGQYDFTQGGRLALSLPANVYAGTYRSEITITAVSGI